jgi:glycosyltransferase involved in cell wall biosynthesis
VRQELGLPLVLDFRDPWATNEVEFGHLPKWLQRRHDSAERDAVLAADLVVSAHPMLTEYFIRRYGIRPDRCATIYNGFDEDDFGVPAPRQTASAKKFTLTHTGSFYRQYNPGVMASALHEHWSSAVKGVDEVELRFVGGAAATEFKRSPGLEIVVTPRVEHDVAVREQIQADMLLLIIDRHFYPGVIAAKLFEYLAAGRPIFGVLPEDGTMAQIIRECRAGWVADCDQPRQIVETLREAVQAVAHPGFRFDPDRERIRQFSRSSQARRMAALFDAIGPAEPTL